MAATIRAVAFQADTGGGTQNVTANLGGLVPTSAYVFFGSATGTDVLVDGWSGGVGQATPAAQHVINLSNSHGVGTTQCYRQNRTGQVIRRLAYGSSTALLGEAEISAWIADGFTLNWLTTPTTAFWGIVVFFAGANTDAAAFRSQYGPSGGTDATGFLADLTFWMTNGTNSTGSASNTNHLYGMGFSHRLPALTNRATSQVRAGNSAATARAPGYYKSSAIACANLNTTSPAALSRGHQVDGYNATDVDLGHTTGSSGTSLWSTRLHIKLDGEQIASGVTRAPTTSQTVRINTGFPVGTFILWPAGHADDNNSMNSASDGEGQFGFSVVDVDGATGTICHCDNGSLTTTFVKTLYSPNAIHHLNKDGTVGWSGSISLDATGIDLVYTTASGSPSDNDFLYLAIEGEVVAPPSTKPFYLGGNPMNTQPRGLRTDG